jgi:hypothetical protein
LAIDIDNYGPGIGMFVLIAKTSAELMASYPINQKLVGKPIALLKKSQIGLSDCHANADTETVSHLCQYLN